MIDLDKVDVRTVQRHIRKGKVSQAEYDAYLKNLPDLDEAAEYLDYADVFAKEAAEEAKKAQEEEQQQSEQQAQPEPSSAPPPASEPPPPATATALAPEPPKPVSSDDGSSTS